MKTNRLLHITFLIILSFVLALPIHAQDSLSDDAIGDITITFDGYVHFDEVSGEIMIGGFVIAPAGAIPPSLLSEGQYVVITGKFLNDETFQLTDIDVNAEEPTEDEVVDEPPAEATEEPTAEATEEPSAEVTPDPTDDTEEEATADCVPSTHPVANRIANEFGVDVETVIAMHCAGNGFGNITKAFILAEAANTSEDGTEIDPSLLIDPQSFLDAHKGGQGWGHIIKESGLHPSDLAPGRRINGKKGTDELDDTDETDTTTSETVTSTSSQSNGNGNGNKGNNGNGKDKNKDKGNNGNGNGNGNGNKGNGKGKS